MADGKRNLGAHKRASPAAGGTRRSQAPTDGRRLVLPDEGGWRKVRRVVKEDAFSGYLAKLVRLWPRINDRNPFAYLTAMVHSATIDEVRRERRRVRVRQRVTRAVRRMTEDAA